MDKVLLNAVLHLPEKVVEELQEQAEEFDFTLDEFISYALIAASDTYACLGDCGSLYERIDWKHLKEKGLCE